MTAISSRVHTLLLALVLVALVALIAMVATRAAGGPLDPAAPPSSTLPQVEPRSPIPQVGWDGVSPITIGSPGSYFLTRNLTQVPITIAAENVTLDLSGFTLSDTGSVSGISLSAGTKRNIVIRNGTLVGPSSGFAISATGAGRSTFSDLQISGWSIGLLIGIGNSATRINSHDNNEGIRVANVGVDFGGSIADSNLSHNAIGIELEGNNVVVRDSVMDANSSNGVDISGSWNEVKNSRMIGNSIYGAVLHGNRIVFVGNHIDGNVTAPVFDSGAGNIIGPISPATSTNPAANIGFP